MHGLVSGPAGFAGKRPAAAKCGVGGVVAGLVAAAVAGLVWVAPAMAQQGLGEAIELVDPTTLRVCADPRNMPFSNEAGEGFENKLAELVAEKLGRGLSYTYFPLGVGFVRNTIGTYRCDLIMGYAQGDELVQNTNAYYRTSYMLVVPADTPLADVTSLADPRLADATLGVVAGTPPATTLARRGLIGRARPYQLMVDTRVDAPVAAMFADLGRGAIDGALAWGPMAGWYARQSPRPLKLIPLTQEDGGSRMVYRITMGVRPSDQAWKRRLNELIRAHQGEIDKILQDFGVPLLDEQDRPLLTASQ